MALTLLTEQNEKQEWEHEGSFQCKFVPEIEDLKYHMRKSDLFLLPLKVSSPLFGTEALSAIATGVPALVPRHTTMDSLLMEMNAEKSVISEPHIDAWAQRISQMIRNPDAAQHEASNLKDRLLLDTSISATHLDCINIISGR